jgi:SAM-dependent methyltransferase
MIEIRRTTLDTPADSADAYDEFYATIGIGLRLSFYKWILRLIDPLPGTTLLDMSCGEAKLATLAERRGVRAIGVDLSPLPLRSARARGVRAVQGDCERMPFPDACFDYVANIGSLEHYLHPQDGMDDMRRVLKPGGLACVMLPNSYGLFGNMPYVWRNGDVFDDGQPLQRYNTRYGWQRMLERAGFVVERIVPYEREVPTSLEDAAWLLRRPTKIARVLLGPIVPVNVANCIVYMCRAA